MQKKIRVKPMSGWRNALKVDGRDCGARGSIYAKINTCCCQRVLPVDVSEQPELG